MTILRKITLKFLLLVYIVGSAKMSTAQMEFVENKGQWDSKVNYRGNFSAGSFFLENKGFTVDLQNAAELEQFAEQQHGLSHGANKAKHTIPAPTQSFTLHSHAYKVNFLGANNNISHFPDKSEPTYNNYFLGNDKTKWASNCKIYQAVTYKNVYRNIDVRYYSDAGHLKYDFIIHPGGNPDAIAMRYDGVTKLEVVNKELIIGTSVGDVKELYPFTYQPTDKSRKVVDCKYVVRDNVVRFKVGNYSPDATLIIDPSLIFSSFTASTQDNWGFTATPGNDGSFFAGGISFGTGYPVSIGAYQTIYGGGQTENSTGGYDIAIMKFLPDGSNRVYATYLGGNGNEQPHSMICDPQGNLIVAGRSNSANYFTTLSDPAQVGVRGGYDIVVTKFNAAGTGIIGSVKMGGTGSDGVNIRPKTASPDGVDSIRRNYGDDARSEVNIDGTGNIYLASCTQSTNFPIRNSSIQTSYGGGRQDGVIIKFTPNLSAVTFSTFFGGNGDDACFVLSLNPVTGNLYVAGGTTSKINLPGNKTGVLQSTYQGGECDGFVTQLFNDGSGVIKTTYQGTSGHDLVYGIQFDKKGFPYIMGTTSGNWPVQNAVYSNPGSKQFISKLQPDFSAYVYSTVFGNGSSQPNLSPVAFLVDRCENVYVSGWGGGVNNERGYPSAGTQNLPEVNPLAGIPAPDGDDFYFFVLEKNAQSQFFGSHFGQNGGFGDHVDGGTSRFDVNGIIYQAICANCGGRNSADFPTTPGVWGPFNRSTICNQAAVKIEMNFGGVGASVKATIDGVFDTVGCVPLRVNFIDTLAKGKKYIWHYGDPFDTKIDTTYAPNNSTSHLYTQVGTFTLMLVSVDSSTCNIADTAYIKVKVGNNIVTPAFKFAKLDSCNSLRFQFDNLTTAVRPAFSGNSFLWDFDDKTEPVRAGLNSVIHTFPSVGSYKVRLTVDDTTFCNAPQFVDTLLRISPNVKAAFTTPARGCAPYDAEFKNTSLGGISFLWEFGDTKTSTDGSPIVTHRYDLPGVYRARLIAIDTSTCNKVDTSAYFTITVYEMPEAKFTWQPNPPVVNTRTFFTNLSSPNATRFFWDFGDGETSVERDPVHQFNATDTFTVSLVAFNPNNCSDTFVQLVPALILPLLDVPNAFTPGRFGTNAEIKVVGFGIAKMNWKIFNRWGQVVFETTNRKQGWNGLYKGVLQPMDVYAYTLDVEFSDGQKLRKTGDINLLR